MVKPYVHSNNQKDKYKHELKSFKDDVYLMDL